jgi:hypothetical protein
MSALQKFTYAQERRDDVLDQELARELAANNDGTGVKELFVNIIMVSLSYLFFQVYTTTQD